MIIAGIDPGQKGGIAIGNEEGKILLASPLPQSGKGLDCALLASLLVAHGVTLVALEKVNSMPKQGVASTFTFGVGFGQVQGVVVGSGRRLELITPQRWKGVVLAGMGKDKSAAIAYCRRAFPSVNLVPAGCSKPSDGIADALCLYEFGRREFGRVTA